MVLALVPVLVAMPSMSDFPGHAARHHIEAFAGRGGPLDRYYVVHWRWIGYLGTDLPAALLTPWLGAEWATRLLTAVIAPATLAAVFALSRAAHGRVTAGAALALPLVLAAPYQFGVLSYGIGFALALFAAASWLSRTRLSVLALAGFALAALVVFTAHLVAWLFLVLLVGGFELAASRSLRDLVGRALRALPLLSPCLPLLIWRSGQPSEIAYVAGVVKWKLMNFATILRGLWMPLDMAMLAALGVLGVAALIMAGGRRLDWRLAVGAGLVALTSLLMPTHMFGGWAADTRLAAAAALVGFIALGPAAKPGRERALFAAGIALFLVRLAATSVVWVRENAVLEKRLTLLDDVPRGSRMGFVVLLGNNCRIPWRIGVEGSMGAYAVIRRDVFTSSLFVHPGSDIVTFRDPADNRWDRPASMLFAKCRTATSDLDRVGQLLRDMATADFGTIWVSGVDAGSVPLPKGYRVVRAIARDVLIGRVPVGPS
ncbi:MAG: hypothetical protein AB7O49_11615 [Sphingomonadales bacterium]